MGCLSLVVLPSVPPRTSRCGNILHLRESPGSNPGGVTLSFANFLLLRTPPVVLRVFPGLPVGRAWLIHAVRGCAASNENSQQTADGPLPCDDIRVVTRSRYHCGPPVASRAPRPRRRCLTAPRTAYRAPRARSRGRGPATTSAARREVSITTVCPSPRELRGRAGGA
jgi:hypothetical protein